MSGRRLALLIANAEYEYVGFKNLAAPGFDACQLKELIERPDVGAFQTELLSNAPKSTIEESLEGMLFSFR